jgi:hypothetical protein
VKAKQPTVDSFFAAVLDFGPSQLAQRRAGSAIPSPNIVAQNMVRFAAVNPVHALSFHRVSLSQHGVCRCPWLRGWAVRSFKCLSMALTI